MRSKLTLCIILIVMTVAASVYCAASELENPEALNSLGFQSRYVDIDLDEFLADKVESLYLSDIDENGVFISLSAGSDLDVYDEAKIIDGNYLIGYDGELYEEPALFYNGIAAVCVDGKYGYIDENYSWIVQPVYDFASDFKNGYGVAYKDGYSYIFSESGECVYRFNGRVYGSIFENGYSLIYKDGRGYILDTDFNEARIEPLDYPTDGVYELISENGTIVFYKEWEKSEDGIRNVYKQEYCIIGRDGKIKYRYVCDATDVERDIEQHWPSWLSVLSSGVVVIGDMAADNITVVDPEGAVLAERDGLDGFNWNMESIGSYVLFGDKIYDESLNDVFTLILENGEFIPSSDYMISYLGDAEFIESNGEVAAYMIGTDQRIDEASNVLFYGLDGMLVLYRSGVVLNDTPNLVDASRIPDHVDNSAISAYLNGNRLAFDKPPITENDRTLVPMRAIFEALEADVKWENDTNTATAVKDGTTISITIDSDVMYKNGEAIQLDAPARLIDDGYTFVPLRAVSEALDCDVQWNEEQQRVDITSD